VLLQKKFHTTHFANTTLKFVRKVIVPVMSPRRYTHLFNRVWGLPCKFIYVCTHQAEAVFPLPEGITEHLACSCGIRRICAMEEFVVETEAKSGTGGEDCLRKADLTLKHTQLAGAIIKTKSIC
jgi:hypothetical protein